jgi:hypothetical protein
MRIGISFSDNDFATYVRAFLLMLPNLNWGTYDKANLVKAFNLVAPELSKLGYVSRHGESHLNYIPDSYFQITADDIYFDDEITSYLDENCKYHSNEVPGTTYYWDNCEFHWIDLETGDIKSL